MALFSPFVAVEAPASVCCAGRVTDAGCSDGEKFAFTGVLFGSGEGRRGTRGAYRGEGDAGLGGREGFCAAGSGSGRLAVFNVRGLPLARG